MSKPKLDHSGNITNQGFSKTLPPGVTSSAAFGSLFVEIGDLHWLTYDGVNYLEDYGKGAKIQDLYANIKFWGESTTQRGIFLKFANGMKKSKETASNKYRFPINCPEPTFEKYLDDMGALIIDFYSAQEGLTIGTSKIIAKLYIKRAKKANDFSPLIELRGQFPITLTGNQDIKIGEFSLSITSSFQGKMTKIPEDFENRENIDLNEDTFVMNERLAQNEILHQQMDMDKRVPSSLAGADRQFAKMKYTGGEDYPAERPVRQKKDQNTNLNQGANSKNLNFGDRQAIKIDENDDTLQSQDQFAMILKRAEKLKQQMDNALEPNAAAWEQIHGVHEIPKTYVPPFMKDEFNEMQKVAQEDNMDIKDKMYDIEVEEGINQNEESFINIEPRGQQTKKHPQALNVVEDQNLDVLPEDESGKRQLMDMRFIRLKVKNLRIENEELLHNMIDKNFNLQVNIPLPDIYQKAIHSQKLQMNNYEVLSFNEFAFNSLSLYNFRVDEDTLHEMVQSQLKVSIEEYGVEGTLNMNKLFLAADFRIEIPVQLVQTIQVKRKDDDLPTRGKQKDKFMTQHIPVGTVNLEINLQSGDSEDEIKRNYQIKMQKMEEERTKAEEERQEMARKKMQFVMEQAPVFGQLYLHIQKMGHKDNLGERESKFAPEKELETSAGVDGGFSSLNNRVTDEDPAKPSTDELDRAVSPKKNEEGQEQKKEEEKQEVKQPGRNIFVQYKAFPNLEQLKTQVAWQQSDEAIFNYRSQFPVLMSPDTLEKMEKFIFVLEVWDQVSPSVLEFIGMVKVPLAPICFSMKTTDQEVYSLNFMADQFCMYPMTVCDGFLPIYSPKLGQDVGHLKVTLAMGSPVQVNRLIQKEQEEERRIAKDIEEKRLWEATIQKEKELKEIRRAKKEKKRQLEEERKAREAESQGGGLEAMLGLGGQTSQTKRGNKSPAKVMQQNITNILKQSLNITDKTDYDQRSQNMLNSLRLLFEEARSQGIEELNGEPLFKDEAKNFDGSVQKDEVMNSLLNNQQLSLTRINVSNILALMLDINRDDQGKVDVDELHFSFKSYIKYYELIEQRIIDLFEKFKIAIVKKFEIQDLIDEFIQDIEDKAEENKIPYAQLRAIFEDRHGIQIRDALFDQLMQFFDLDRNNEVYIKSLCEYLKNPTSENINFFKVNPHVISNQIQEYVRNSIETSPDCMEKLEKEFMEEIWKNPLNRDRYYEKKDTRTRNRRNKDTEAGQIPVDLLIDEKINAKLFQYKLKRLGIALSLWEVFTIFEVLNGREAKMFFEPQRYHHLMFGHFYKFIHNQEYTRMSVEEQKRLAKEARSKSKSKTRQASPIKQTTNYNNQPKPVRTEEQYDYKDESESQFDDDYSEESEGENKRPFEQVKHIFEIKVQELKNIPVLNKFINQTQNVVHNTQNITDPKEQKIARAQANKYIQNVAVKYSFPLDEDEILESDYLQLNKESLEQQGVFNYNVSMDTVHTYILNKQDKIGKVLEICQSRGHQNSQSNMNEGSTLAANRGRREELFNISIALYNENREYVIGNSHLPIEDLIDTITQFDTRSGTYNRKTKKTTLARTLFIYGSSYSQRENCIIGKLMLNVEYSQEPQFLSKRESALFKKQQQAAGGNLYQYPFNCFMHRETFINRKIPLNAKLAVLIDRVSNLKDSIENIEHFANIQHSALGIDFSGEQDFASLSHTSMVHNYDQLQHLDRRRVLKTILKQGLNLICKCSMFEEDQELVKKFDESVTSNLSKYQTRMLFNSLNPVFGEVFEMNLQMDTKIFEYIKNKRAIFEIRHYIIESNKQKVTKLRQSMDLYGDDLNMRLPECEELESQRTLGDEEIYENCDYIVLGHVRVPLLQLITKNNGVEGDFSIFDEFKQKMGFLRLKITLNHHNSQRPLYSQSSKPQTQNNDPVMPQVEQKKTLIDKSVTLSTNLRRGSLSEEQKKHHDFILGIDFIELILKNKKSLLNSQPELTQRFYLKYTLLNKVYQTKFVTPESAHHLSPLNVLLSKVKLQKFDIGKINFTELQMSDQAQIEEAFGKPLEIQLWHKVESKRTYEKPVIEEMIGQFFVDLNDLSKMTNRRLKDQKNENSPGKFQVFEGYFACHESKRDVLSSDRLGMRLYLFNKDHTNETLTIEDLNSLFNINRPLVERCLYNKLDQGGKGYTDFQDLKQAIKDQISDLYLANKLLWFVETSLEFKDVDKVYYSPLFGLPPPYFKYSKKFDQVEIVCKICEELEALDSHDNGFVPVNLFRNSLETELKIKAKIVEDFINNLRDYSIENSNIKSQTAIVKEIQTLDVNLITNSLKSSHVDYIVLLRKLAQFMDQNPLANNSQKLIQSEIQGRITNLNDQKEVTMFIEIDNAMRLKNPLTGNSPPSTSVYMQPRLQIKENGMFIETSVIKNNGYPTWNYRSQNFTVPLTEQNLQIMKSGEGIEFEVFHHENGATHLIGSAVVPLRPLVEGRGKLRLTGLYDIVQKGEIYRQSINSMSSFAGMQSQGKVKICVTVNKNIPQQLEDQGQGHTMNDRLEGQFSFAENKTPVTQSLQSVSLNQGSPQKGQHLEIGLLESQHFQQIDSNLRSYDSALGNAHDDQLYQMHMSNMSDLDSLNKKLKDSMAVLDVPDAPKMADMNDDLARSSMQAPAILGHATYKTDLQRTSLEQQIKDFRSNHLEEVKRQIVEEKQVAEEVHEDPALTEKVIDSPAFGENRPADDEIENVFKNNLGQSKSAVDETFDQEEFDRLQKILKNQ